MIILDGGNSTWLYLGPIGNYSIFFYLSYFNQDPKTLLYVIHNRLALAIATYMPGTDDESRFVRKTLVRQCNLMAVLLLRGLSNPVFNRAKVLEDAVRAGGL